MVKQDLKSDLARIEAILEGRSVTVKKTGVVPVAKHVSLPVAKRVAGHASSLVSKPEVKAKPSSGKASELFNAYQKVIEKINALVEEQMRNRDKADKLKELQAEEAELQAKADKLYNDYLKARG